MGNWRKVTIVGKCDKKQVKALEKAIKWDMNDTEQEFHSLMNTRSLLGIGNWAKESIHSMGNLAERDYSPQDVMHDLAKLLLVAPSLEVTINCGDEWESDKCVATIKAKNGSVQILEPEVDVL